MTNEIINLVEILLSDLHNIAVKLDGRPECNNGTVTADIEKGQLGINFRIIEEEIRDCLSVLKSNFTIKDLEKLTYKTTSGELLDILYNQTTIIN